MLLPSVVEYLNYIYQSSFLNQRLSVKK